MISYTVVNCSSFFFNDTTTTAIDPYLTTLSLHAALPIVLLGYTGLPSFGHGAVLGSGAYAFGLAQFEVWPNLWFCLAAAIIVTGLFGAVTALFLSHRRGIYFALMTIAFGQIYYFVASKWTSVTHGEDGLLNIARLPAQLGVVDLPTAGNVEFYYLCFAAYAVLVVLLWRLTNSPYGRVLRAIKQNPTRVAFVGYPVTIYKWSVFTQIGSASCRERGGQYV